MINRDAPIAAEEALEYLEQAAGTLQDLHGDMEHVHRLATLGTLAASIARYFINANRSIGLIQFGDDLRVDEPDRGANQYTRILESLALARAGGDVSISSLLTEESRRFGRHTTVIVVTPSTDEEWPLTLMALQSRGVKVATVLLEAETWGAPESSLNVYGSLAAGGVYTYTVKRSDDFSRVLGMGGEAPAEHVVGRPGTAHT